MSAKKVVVVGAGPCGLVALKEMLEAGHDAVALEKGPAIGGVFRADGGAAYDNLYLTISNLLMAYSDFPPPGPRPKYSSAAEYGAYLEAYADAFGLRRRVRLGTEVVRARFDGARWEIAIRDGAGAEELLTADALIVATGSNQVPRTIALPGFTGRVMHSSEYRRADDFAGQRVLVIGAGESAFDIAADVGAVAARTTVWSRSPLAPAPRFTNHIWKYADHDEVDVMKDEAKWSRLRVSDFLETMTTSRMANAAPLWAYSTIRHGIFGILSLQNDASRRLSRWNRQNIAGEPLRGDQVSIPTKSARLCTEAARGRVRVVIAAEAAFSGRDVAFTGVIDDGSADLAGGPARVVREEGFDVAVLCTGFRTEFAWLEVDGLEWSPRRWFKHCFPPGLGHALMFVGWARPHQGGIPACAEMLARYAAMVLAGTRALPDDYARRAAIEGADEDAYYIHDRHSPNLVDYFAFMDSVARLIGCLPRPPSRPERRVQFWVYPNWPLWYRLDGPGAKPEVVESVLSALPLWRSFMPDPFNMMALGFSLMQTPLTALTRPRAGLRGLWPFKAKRHLLHGNA